MPVDQKELQVDKIVEAVIRELAESRAAAGSCPVTGRPPEGQRRAPGERPPAGERRSQGETSPAGERRSLRERGLTGERLPVGEPAPDGADLESEPAEGDIPEPVLTLDVPSPGDAGVLKAEKKTTPARIGVGRTGPRYTTRSLLRFWVDHAAAVDAVFNQVPGELLAELGFVTATTQVQDKDQYLVRPDLGRRLSEESRRILRERCEPGPQVQIVVADGLSSSAVVANIRDLLPALKQSLEVHGLKAGTPIFVQYGRVAIMDDIGDLLRPETIVVLIGERPGLVTAESMSAYMCYRPNLDSIESDRTVISNIHRGGIPPAEAGSHLGRILRRMIDQQASGVRLAASDEAAAEGNPL